MSDSLHCFCKLVNLPQVQSNNGTRTALQRLDLLLGKSLERLRDIDKAAKQSGGRNGGAGRM